MVAGDGDVTPAIGRARRMQVPKGVRQADVMIEAVENHMPEVIVIERDRRPVRSPDHSRAGRAAGRHGSRQYP